jgi:protein-L-isoaspartate(D-aspartate) O-methyltransferase
MISLNGAKREDAISRSRREMVETQLQVRDITDAKVLKAMMEVPRHLFVPEEFRHKAYNDCPLPIGENQTISQPYMVAVMTQLLELSGIEKALEIGTGSGYQTAVLGLLAEQVYSVERIPALLSKARRTIESLNYHNIAMKVSDGTLGWSDFGPYDVILVTAGGPSVPGTLVDQLKTGGRLVMPTGDRKSQVLKKIVKTPSGKRVTSHEACTFVNLIGRHGWEERK